MKTLTEIFSEIGHFGSDIGCNDKGGTHSYLETYEKIFSQKRDGINFLEIGLALGHSVKLFDEYFTNSKLVGVDITLIFTPEKYKNDVHVFEVDATKE